jgi:alpha-ketoglutaric semialdehyde dehydrogenase
MTIRGLNIVGAVAVEGSAGVFQAVSPATGQALGPDFSAAGPAEVDRACALAAAAFDVYRETTLEDRARFLETIAEKIEALGEPLIERAMAESGLPRARLEGERGRTCGQLRMFAGEVRRGDWLGVRIDPAQPDRKPLPRSDIRQRRVALGPVAVFGASNFPLAFSVAGGDTASALAAGCPVVVKGHPAHPGVSELVASAISEAVKACNLPEGVFSMLAGPSNALGEALVNDPRIKAVGFTGSRGGGLALVRIANARAEPIPVYAEMSSINPVFLFPGALGKDPEGLAKAFVGSLGMGAGQFCTNPGLVLALDTPELDRFVAAAAEAVKASAPQVMLTPGIHQAYEAGVAGLVAADGVTEKARGCIGEGVNQGRGGLFETTAEAFRANPVLSHEVFGASSLVVRCPDIETMVALIETFEGQLTATLHFVDEDHDSVKRLLPGLERKAGRILANGWPTGVEVGHAMVHGGPFPATSDGRSTSVGTLAIDRFLRPVCYQDLPDALLPSAVRGANPLKLNRRLDGELTLG